MGVVEDTLLHIRKLIRGFGGIRIWLVDLSLSRQLISVDSSSFKSNDSQFVPLFWGERSTILRSELMHWNISKDQESYQL